MSAVSVRLEGLPGSTRPRIQGRSVSASGAVAMLPACRGQVPLV